MAKKRHRGNAIRRTALELFERHGYDDTTVEDVAHASDVSPRTVFRYFATKADLVFDDRHHGMAGLADRVAVRSTDESLVEAIRNAAGELLCELAAADDGLGVRQLRVAMATPALRPVCNEMLHCTRPELVRAFAQRMVKGETDLAPRVLGAACAETILIAVETWLGEGAEPARFEPVLTAALDVLTSGLV